MVQVIKDESNSYSPFVEKPVERIETMLDKTMPTPILKAEEPVEIKKPLVPDKKTISTKPSFKKPADKLKPQISDTKPISTVPQEQTNSLISEEIQ